MSMDGLRGPLECYHVGSPEAYLAFQARVLAHNHRERPDLYPQGQASRAATPLPPLYIGAGKLLGRCPCGDCVIVDPDWRLGCCCACGAIYEQVDLPEDLSAIVDVLAKRARMHTRNWSTETVDELRAENVAHGEAA